MLRSYINEKNGITSEIGPESTVDFCKLVIGAFKEKQADISYLGIIIYSLNLSRIMRMLKVRDWESLTECLLEKVVA